MIPVVAAIIKRNDTYLIARRAKHKDHVGKWEFPGGKVDQGETPEKALERELFEEFGIMTKTGKYITTNIYDYDNFQIELMAYEVHHIKGAFQLTDHDQIAWIGKHNIHLYDLSGADVGIWNVIAASL